MKLFIRVLLFLIVPLHLCAKPSAVFYVDSISVSDTVNTQRTFDYFFLRAVNLREQERYDEAFDLFEHCLSLNPNSAAVSYELYWMYAYLGRKAEALEMMKRAVNSDPANYWYSQTLASAYEDEGMSDDAIALYERMVQQFPSHVELLYILSDKYVEGGEYIKAVETLDRLERADGKSMQIALQKYRVYMLMHEKELAIAELQSLVDENPDDTRMMVFLGDTYMKFGEKDKALYIYNSVLDADRDNVDAMVSLVGYYREIGDDTLFTHNMEKLLSNEKYSGEERAAMLVKYVGYKEQTGSTEYNYKLFERLMNLHYDQAETAEIYANYLLMKDAAEDSVTPVLQTLLRYEPENNFARLQLLNYAIKRNDYNEVVALCDTAILYNPEVLELYYYRGISYYNLDRLSDAISTFEAGLRMHTDNHEPQLVSDMFGLVGDIYHELGNWGSCVEAYDSALVYDNDNLSVLNNYAYYLALDGSALERAEEMSLRTIKAEPENTVYLDTYMWVLFLLERYDEAKAYAEKLIDLDKDEMGAVVLHHCGDVFAKCGDIERAVMYWKRAQEKGDTSKILKKKIKRRKYVVDKK